MNQQEFEANSVNDDKSNPAIEKPLNPHRLLSLYCKRALLPRFFWKSKFMTRDRNNKVTGWQTATYVRPKIKGAIKGKLAQKMAKRQRVKELKAKQSQLKTDIQ